MTEKTTAWILLDGFLGLIFSVIGIILEQAFLEILLFAALLAILFWFWLKHQTKKSTQSFYAFARSIGKLIVTEALSAVITVFVAAAAAFVFDNVLIALLIGMVLYMLMTADYINISDKLREYNII